MSIRDRLRSSKQLIADQLRMGLSPEKLSWTIVAGAGIGIFPVLGSTTLLCFFLAGFFRLNQPVIQIVNYLVYPLQLILLIPFFQVGAWMTGNEVLPFTLSELVSQFQSDFFGTISLLGWAQVRAIAAWVVFIPVPMAGLRWVLLVVFRKRETRIGEKGK
ncbi:MAG: DUF2062 domain-containing protein [Bacteroidetes bacterium]|nr:DUF2062 domain-containing protein [Bacteroidota bacterium]